MVAIFRREFRTYFTSAIGYIFLAVFFVFGGYFFTENNIANSTTSLTNVFSAIITIFIFLIPVLTMRLMCEEKKQKTDQLLLTAPVSLFGIVFGKFLAAFAVYAMGLSCMVLYAFTMALYISVDSFAILGSIVGMLLLGAAFISIGLFISNLTENQVISAVASFFIILMLYLMDGLSSSISNVVISKIFSFLSVYTRFTNFSLGIFNLGDAVYYLSFTAVFLFLTVRVLEKRRWS